MSKFLCNPNRSKSPVIYERLGHCEAIGAVSSNNPTIAGSFQSQLGAAGSWISMESLRSRKVGKGSVMSRVNDDFTSPFPNPYITRYEI